MWPLPDQPVGEVSGRFHFRKGRTVLPPLPPLKSFSYPSFRSEGGPAGVSDLVHRLPHSFGKPGGIGVFASVVYRQEFADNHLVFVFLGTTRFLPFEQKREQRRGQR